MARAGSARTRKTAPKGQGETRRHFVCNPDGNHGVANKSYQARSMLTDWMGERPAEAG